MTPNLTESPSTPITTYDASQCGVWSTVAYPVALGITILLSRATILWNSV
jgi:hypothetical protein